MEKKGPLESLQDKSHEELAGYERYGRFKNSQEGINNKPRINNATSKK